MWAVLERIKLQEQGLSILFEIQRKNQTRVIRCYNCNGEGFLADNLEETNDCEDLYLQATINFKADHVDAYDLDCDDEAIANAIFMENLSHVDEVDHYVPPPVQNNNMILSVIEQMKSQVENTRENEKWVPATCHKKNNKTYVDTSRSKQTEVDNTKKHAVKQNTQKTDNTMLPSTGRVSSANDSGLKPRSNAKNDRIQRPSCKSKKNKVEVQLGSLTIMRYGDLQIGNTTISRVYYIEGLGHNLFCVGQFCDSDLEVAFRKHLCFVRKMKGVDLLSGSCVRYLCTNNGTKFINQALRNYTKEVGITYHTSTARTPQQNGVVERHNRTLVEAASTMLIFSKSTLFLWAEVVATACYTQNRSLIHTHYNKTTYELLRDRKPELKYTLKSSLVIRRPKRRTRSTTKGPD
nr:putative ribonuclease H-like domain-containing protein [Tanacetum cinerariifolium]